jgi:hypothetical protein
MNQWTGAGFHALRRETQLTGRHAGEGWDPWSGATRCKVQKREASGSANLVVPTRRRINRPVPHTGGLSGAQGD